MKVTRYLVRYRFMSQPGYYYAGHDSTVLSIRNAKLFIREQDAINRRGEVIPVEIDLPDE